MQIHIVDRVLDEYFSRILADRDSVVYTATPPPILSVRWLKWDADDTSFSSFSHVSVRQRMSGLYRSTVFESSDSLRLFRDLQFDKNIVGSRVSGCSLGFLLIDVSLL
jgi:hypothetical protein